MRIFIVPKAELSEQLNQILIERIAAPDHQFDNGALRSWNIYNNGTLYAFIHKELRVPLGIAEASGPLDAANAAWWIDSKFRGQRYGHELADLLAGCLKTKGYKGVGYIRIDTHLGKYDQASIKIRERFRSRFERA
jgi:RimJ/RimL family protein N-acetyltransferase